MNITFRLSKPPIREKPWRDAKKSLEISGFESHILIHLDFKNWTFLRTLQQQKNMIYSWLVVSTHLKHISQKNGFIFPR